MKNSLKRSVALLLGLILCVGSFSALAISSFAEEGSAAEIKKGEFIYAPHTYMDGDLTDIYYYTDDFFNGPATEYNEHLATASMILAAASISSQDHDADYTVKSRNLSHLLREWDFSSFEVNEYYTQKPGEQTMGVGIAAKIIGEGENAYTVLAIVPRSAGYEKEWAGNFTVGVDGVHQGFATGRDIILEFAKQYVEENADNFEGTVKIWTVGYSRGAGVANLLAAYLNDNPTALGVEVNKENIFAYAFGTPSNVQYSSDEEKAALESNYLNIHNRYAEYDIVTYVPFKNWNFTYYGTTKLFDVHNAEKKAEMLEFLEKTNKTIYDLYSAENSGADPDNFVPLMLSLDLTDGIKTSMVPADPSYGIPSNQKDFLDSRIDFLISKLVPDRDTYVNGGYEYALQRLTSLYFGLNAEQGAKLFEGMSHDLPTLAASYYCYFLSDFYLNEATSSMAVGALASSFSTIEGYMAALAENPEVSSSEWYLYAVAFMNGEQYAQLKATLEAAVSDSQLIASNIEAIKGTVKSFAVGMTAKVLGSGVMALTMDETEKQELFATMTSPEVAGPLTNFFVYLLLGSEEPTVSAFDPSNKNVALAVTFLSNAGRYMRVHNNEIILSWLRTEDSYYADEDYHIHKEEIKYDANGHWHECACGYKEEVCEHIFSEWEALPSVEGAPDKLIRYCACGYEETKDAPASDTQAQTTAAEPKAHYNKIITIVIVSVGAALIVATSVIMVVVIKKRNAKK